jgi:hypothetical protein
VHFELDVNKNMSSLIYIEKWIFPGQWLWRSDGRRMVCPDGANDLSGLGFEPFGKWRKGVTEGKSRQAD